LFEQSVDLAPLRWGLMDLGYAYARAGRVEDAEEQIERLKSSAGEPASYEIALVLGALGRPSDCAVWLERAVAEHSYLLAQHGSWDPRLAELLGSDGLNELRSRMNRLPTP
jgi:hypothetical protein